MGPGIPKSVIFRAQGEGFGQISKSRFERLSVAQLAAAAQLLSLRRPDLLEATELPKKVPVCEPDMEPELDSAEKEGKDIFHATNPPREDSGIVGRQVAKILLESVPAFQLGLTAEFLSEVLRKPMACRQFLILHGASTAQALSEP
eukprot:symbB.v1.2.034951.t1/scaffold4605.1/size37493/4